MSDRIWQLLLVHRFKHLFKEHHVSTRLRCVDRDQALTQLNKLIFVSMVTCDHIQNEVFLYFSWILFLLLSM